jgi:hypothetical protein
MSLRRSMLASMAGACLCPQEDKREHPASYSPDTRTPDSRRATDTENTLPAGAGEHLFDQVQGVLDQGWQLRLTPIAAGLVG